ncbi:MAG TPA: CBS domain-containing protein [Nitrospirota bacterium]|nr:CBS domain-containing protein [Nitrospirota bacterium]
MKEQTTQLTEDDFREALSNIGTFVDITENDLKKLYEAALKISKERSVHSWLAGEIMTRDVISIKGDMDLHEAGRLLIKHKISGMPVVDDENRVIGIISQADLLSMAGVPPGHVFNDVVMKYILARPTPQHRSGRTVKDLMSTHVITVGLETAAKQIAALLDKKGITRVPVVDAEKKLIGIVSRSDIVRILCEDSKEPCM